MAIMPMFPNVRTELDRFFDAFALPSILPTAAARAFPALNLWEEDDNLIIEGEVPGLKMDDLYIVIQGHELTVRGNRRPVRDSDATYLRRERGTGEFVRYLTLPCEVDADKVAATLRDGVLTIRMPKSERAKARKIQVRAEGV